MAFKQYLPLRGNVLQHIGYINIKQKCMFYNNSYIYV